MKENKGILYKIMHHTVSKIILVIITGLISIGGAYAGVNVIIDIVHFVSIKFVESEEQKIIKQLSTDISDEYFDELLGKPLVRINIGEPYEKYREDIYKTENTIIKTVIDTSTRMACAYYVVVRTNRKKFELPFRICLSDNKYFDKPLYVGDVTLTMIPYEPDTIWYNISTKFATYTESFYFGNPGNYKTFLLGYNENGHVFMNKEEFKHFVDLFILTDKFNYDQMNENKDKILASEHRKYIRPNSFGVISASLDRYMHDYLTSDDVGIDWATAKDLNLR